MFKTTEQFSICKKKYYHYVYTKLVRYFRYTNYQQGQ